MCALPKPNTSLAGSCASHRTVIRTVVRTVIARARSRLLVTAGDSGDCRNELPLTAAKAWATWADQT